MKALDIQVADPIDPHRQASVDSTLRVFVGHDLFYFADAGSRDRFTKDLLRYCRRLTDPVTQRRFRPTRRSRHLDRGGRAYWFASDSTYRVFMAMPDSFAVRKGM